MARISWPDNSPWTTDTPEAGASLSFMVSDYWFQRRLSSSEASAAGNKNGLPTQRGDWRQSWLQKGAFKISLRYLLPLLLPVSAVRTDFNGGLDRLGAVQTNLGFRHVAHDFIWLDLRICEFPFRMTDEEVEQRADEMEKHDGQHPAGFFSIAQALILDRAHEHPDPENRQRQPESHAQHDQQQHSDSDDCFHRFSFRLLFSFDRAHRCFDFLRFEHAFGHEQTHQGREIQLQLLVLLPQQREGLRLLEVHLLVFQKRVLHPGDLVVQIADVELLADIAQ